MKALILERQCDIIQETEPLKQTSMPDPQPGPGEVLIRVRACGVCHTEVDEIEGRTPPPLLPIIPGHQVIGYIQALGPGAKEHEKGDRVGVGWIFSSCGTCVFCMEGNENLCSRFRATGRDANGGYAEKMIVNERYAFPIPKRFSDAGAAPLLCAGSIGYRSLRLSGFSNGKSLGLMGFGSSAHLMLQLAKNNALAAKYLYSLETLQNATSPLFLALLGRATSRRRRRARSTRSLIQLPHGEQLLSL